MTNSYIAFDFGLKRIGVAVGQAITKTATPMEFIAAKDGIPDWDCIERLIAKWRPEKIIVGIPLNMDETQQPITFCARKFANRLQHKFNIPVEPIDERLTTVEARAQLFKQGGYKSLKKGVIDSVAAKIMLEDWLGRN